MVMTGLCALLVAMILIAADPTLRRDFVHRLCNRRAPDSLFSTGLIVLAIAVSHPFGYSSQQVIDEYAVQFYFRQVPCMVYSDCGPDSGTIRQERI